MKTIVIISITILLNSCFYSKELNQWKSKKYNDNHFYNALKEPVAMDTNNFKLNQIYICKTDSGTYRHVYSQKIRKFMLLTGQKVQ